MNPLKHHPPMPDAVQGLVIGASTSTFLCTSKLAQGETAITNNTSEGVYEFETSLNSSLEANSIWKRKEKARWKNILKPGAMALGLGLMLTTLCYGQANTFGPPHNVIYWNGDTNQLQTLAASSYTDVIVNFVTPDWSCNLSGLPSNIVNSIQTLHNNGKTVLVSLGGSNVQSGQYAACNSNEGYLVNQLAKIVTSNGFDGVDIDFEDTSAFQGTAAYDGVQFLTELTDDLYNDLPQWSIITHAPQTPYWLQNYIYQYPPYAQIYWNTNWQTNEIAWFNTQFYNNCPWGWDCTAQAKIADYNNIVNWWGVQPISLVMGLPVAQCATGTDSHPCTGDGYIPLNDGSNNDVETVLVQLLQAHPDTFGGIMGWNYADDQNYDKGAWGHDVAGGLYAFAVPFFDWVGLNKQTGLCLDSGLDPNGNGDVGTDTCGRNSQEWRFDVNAIQNAQTGQCLDSNNTGQVYTKACNGANSQNWEFFGNVIFNRQTRRCLDSNSNGQAYTQPCNGGYYQNWTLY